MREAELLICRPFFPTKKLADIDVNCYFVDLKNLDVVSILEVSRAYGLIYMERTIYAVLKKEISEISDKVTVIDDIITESDEDINNIPVAFLPSSDTHVHSMLPISKCFPNHIYLIPDMKSKEEGASAALKQHGESYIEIAYDATSCPVLEKFRPRFVFCLTDWTSEFYAVKRILENTGSVFVALQEGPEDWHFRTRNRMDVLNHYRNADVIFATGAKTFNYIRPKFFAVTGNPKVSTVEYTKWPKLPKVLINCNFTYTETKPPYESKRELWMDSVLRVCKKIGIDYIISKHPRDFSTWDNEPIINSNAFSLREQIDQCSICISRFSTVIYEALCRGRVAVYYNIHMEPMPLYQDESNNVVQCVLEEGELENLLKKHITDYQRHIDHKDIELYLNKHMSKMDGKVNERILNMLSKISSNKVDEEADVLNAYVKQERSHLTEKQQLLEGHRNIVVLFDYENIPNDVYKQWIDVAEQLSDAGWKVFLVLRRFTDAFTSYMHYKEHQRIEVMLTKDYLLDFCGVPIDYTLVSQELMTIEEYKTGLQNILNKSRELICFDTPQLSAIMSVMQIKSSNTVKSDCSSQKNPLEQFVFPYHLFPKGSNIVIYGAGNVGKDFYRQLSSSCQYIKNAGIVDKNADKTSVGTIPVRPVSDLKNIKFDYVLIAIKNKKNADDARYMLLDMGIKDDRIVWAGNMYSRDDFYKNYYFDHLERKH